MFSLRFLFEARKILFFISVLAYVQGQSAPLAEIEEIYGDIIDLEPICNYILNGNKINITTTSTTPSFETIIQEAPTITISVPTIVTADGTATQYSISTEFFLTVSTLLPVTSFETFTEPTLTVFDSITSTSTVTYPTTLLSFAQRRHLRSNELKESSPSRKAFVKKKKNKTKKHRTHLHKGNGNDQTDTSTNQASPTSVTESSSSIAQAIKTLLDTYGEVECKKICLDLFDGGNSANIPTSTVEYFNTKVDQITETQGTTFTDLVTGTFTALTTQTVPSIVNFTSTSIADALTIPASVTVTPTPTTSTVIDATETVYSAIAQTETITFDPLTTCGDDSTSCQCSIDATTFYVTCNYVYSGTPSYFVAPCKGIISADLTGGTSYVSDPNGNVYGNPYSYMVSSDGIDVTGHYFPTTLDANTQFQIRVGGDGTTNYINTGSSGNGPGGYNGGGTGGGSDADLNDNFFALGGGGATDLTYMKYNRVVLAAAGVGGGLLEANGNLNYYPGGGQCGPDSGDTQPQGQNANFDDNSGNPEGGGGGGGYPGGSAGEAGNDAGCDGTNLINENTNDYSQQVYVTTSSSSGGSANIYFQCVA